MITLFLVTLRDKRWSLFGWSLGVIAMAWLTIIFFPSISQSGSFGELSKTLPPQLKGLLGDALAFQQLDHYIGQQVLSLRLPMLTLVFAVILGLGLSVGEEDRRTLKTLQTFPISRGKVAFAKWLVILLTSLVVAIAAGVGVLIGVVSINETISMHRLLEASFLLWLLTAAMASVTFGLGLATGKKGLTTLLASLFVAVNILLPSIAADVEELQIASKFTVYHYYSTPQILVDNLDWEHVLVMALVSVLSFLVAFVCYKRRDIAT